jgi:DNA mismatch endonuclease (patch repair protein)
MRAIRRRDTGPEREIRSRLHREGLRFRVDFSISLNAEAAKRARPDIVFTRQRLAIFIDGCFWHACPEHGRKPTKNQQYWSPKIARNVQRDEEQTTALKTEGWKVLRIWAHTPAAEAADLIQQALR